MFRHQLEVKLQNKLTLTPSLRQQITILALQKVELQNLIKEELGENPFLEEEIYLNTDSEPIDLSTPYYDMEEDKKRLNQIPYTPSLSQLLEFQIEVEFSEEEREVAKEIVGNIDDKGFLAVDTVEIARKVGKSPQFVEEVRQKVLSLEPTGIGSKNLKEYLSIQYREVFGSDPLVEDIINNHLEHINDIKQLSQLYPQVDTDKLGEIIHSIKMLKPYPTAGYGGTQGIYIEPDVIVYEGENGYIVEVNQREIPKLKLTKRYSKLLSDKKLTEETRKFLKKKLEIADGIIKGIQQRQENLKRITELIVKHQTEFIKKGNGYIKPLILKDVAQWTGLHESTVSRIVSNKYVQLPDRIIPLKAFFSNRLPTENGDISTDRVKYMIAKLIESEDKTKPLSDQKIAQILKEKGIKIARRTVAKYREQLNIPDSRERRRKL